MSEVAAAVTTGKRERYYVASQWIPGLVKFRRHKLAMAGAAGLILLYTAAALADFVAPYSPTERFSGFLNCPPARVASWTARAAFHLRPFVYAVSCSRRQREAARRLCRRRDDDAAESAGSRPAGRYRMLGSFPRECTFSAQTPARSFSSAAIPRTGHLFPHGPRLAHLADRRPRRRLSQLRARRVLGGVSGYFGGIADTLVQRSIDLLISIPHIPLWMALPRRCPSIFRRSGPTFSSSSSSRSRVGGASPGSCAAAFSRCAKRTSCSRPGSRGRGASPSSSATCSVVRELHHRAPHPRDPRNDPGRDGAELSRAGAPAPGGQLGGPSQRRAADRAT